MQKKSSGFFKIMAVIMSLLMTTTVFTDVDAVYAANAIPLTFTAKQIGGESGVANTIGIRITFTPPLSRYDVEDYIAITNGTGDVTLSDDYPEHEEYDDYSTVDFEIVSVKAQGDVTVSVKNFSDRDGNYNVVTEPQTVAVYKNTTNNPTPVEIKEIIQYGGESGESDTEQIEIVFDRPVVGLSDENVSFDGTGSVVMDTGSYAVDGESTDWTIRLDSVEKEGTVNVTISDFGDYTVTNSPIEVDVYKDAREKIEVSYTVKQIGGEPGKKDSTAIEITFNKPVTGFENAYFGYNSTIGDVDLAWDVTGEGKVWRFGIDEVIREGAMKFEIENFENFIVTNNPQEFTVYKKPGVPSVPVIDRIDAEDRSITLEWGEPDTDGGSEITKYQISYGATSGYKENWQDIPDGPSADYHTIDGLTNGTEYTVEVRAVTTVGNGKSAKFTATPTVDGIEKVLYVGNQVDGLAVVRPEGRYLSRFDVISANVTSDSAIQLENVNSVEGISLEEETIDADGNTYIFVNTTAETPAGEHPLRVEADGVTSNIFFLIVTAKEAEPDPDPSRYYVNVEDSHANNTGEGYYTVGAEVTIRAGSRSGYSFEDWDADSNDVDFDDDNDRTTTFIMPDHNVEVTAYWDRNSSSSNNSSSGSGYRPPNSPPNYPYNPPTTSTQTRPAPSTEPAISEAPPIEPEAPSNETYAVTREPNGTYANVEASAVINGNGAVITVSRETVDAAFAEAAAGANGTMSPIVVNISSSQLTQGLTNGTVSVPLDAIKDLASANNTVLQIDLGANGIITIPNAALKTLNAATGGNVTVSLSRGTVAEFTIAVDGNPVSNFPGGVKVVLPGLMGGNAAILTKPDGTTDILEKSVVINGILYAVVNGSGTIQTMNNSKLFTDVSVDDPYFTAVDFVTSRGIFTGTSTTEMTFSPQMSLSRGMLVTMLHRLENNTGVMTGQTFADVPPGQWFSNSVAWATQTGLTVGDGTGNFGVNDTLSREQLAVFLYRYANSIGMVTNARGNLAAYADGGEVSPWAAEAMSWAVGAGLFRGEANLGAADDASRAVTAEMMMNFIQMYFAQ